MEEKIKNNNYKMKVYPEKFPRIEMTKGKTCAIIIRNGFCRKEENIVCG